MSDFCLNHESKLICAVSCISCAMCTFTLLNRDEIYIYSGQVLLDDTAPTVFSVLFYLSGSSAKDHRIMLSLFRSYSLKLNVANMFQLVEMHWLSAFHRLFSLQDYIKLKMEITFTFLCVPAFI